MAVAAPPRCSFPTTYNRCCPFGPCTDAVHGAPGHNRWGVVETPLPVKTQGETMNCYFNLPPQVLLQCGFEVSGVLRRGGQSPRYRRRNRTAVTSVVTGPVLGVRRHSKASDAMLEHRRVPLAQRGRMSGLARDMLTR